MRCIEILPGTGQGEENKVINRNMRCIEIIRVYHARLRPRLINRNMRCIEILPVCSIPSAEARLIET